MAGPRRSFAEISKAFQELKQLDQKFADVSHGSKHTMRYESARTRESIVQELEAVRAELKKEQAALRRDTRLLIIMHVAVISLLVYAVTIKFLI